MKVRISPHRRLLRAPDLRLLRRRTRSLLTWLEQEDSELSITLLDDPEMAELNESYRSRPGPTDVLSFSLREGPVCSQYSSTLAGRPAVALVQLGHLGVVQQGDGELRVFLLEPREDAARTPPQEPPIQRRKETTTRGPGDPDLHP